jgi:hypothetical protein
MEMSMAAKTVERALSRLGLECDAAQGEVSQKEN